MVTVNNLTVRADNCIVLNNVSCALMPGRITSFIGASGAGKTTLLSALIGLVTPASGAIRIDGTQLSGLLPQQRSKTIGCVFQDFNLFTRLTVLENCVDPLRVSGMPLLQAQQRAVDVLGQLGLQDFLDRYPAQLSGGQKQRVAIARALVLQPSVLLLDEPTASLDPFNTDMLVSILQALAQQGLTIALSSQDMGFVRKIFDRVYCLDKGTIIEFCDGDNLTACPRITEFMKTS